MALSRTQLADPDCPVSDDDYDAIEGAIMETARGRWFLFEYARRHRHADTMMVMSAINSLHDSLQTKLQGNVQSALAAQRRGPYQVSTTVTAALLEQRPDLGTAAPAANPAPPQAAVAGKPAAAEPFEIPGTDDRFEFK